ncbi:MAG: D-2-hydroxyacid dehydrogenase, partial [Clostridia bacterium]|nr:D-2-hydroxyacid dehydrogenase [Clostridia bacterium]
VCNRSKISEKNVKQVDFETLLEKSDIVSLHCPLNEQSKGIMNEQAFAKMKKGALFINTARGPLVDENALKNALESGKLVGVGLDVLTTEPMSKDCPLFGIKNCIITPQIAWAGLETRERLVKIVYENVEAFLNGKPKNQVN